MRLFLFLTLLAGCTSNDACEGLGTCLALDVKGSGPIDQLLLDVSGQVNGTRKVPPSPRAASLPQTVALEFNPPTGFKGSFDFQIDVTAMHKLLVVGSGHIGASMTVGEHSSGIVFVTPGGQPGETDMAQSRSPFDLAAPPDLSK